jgi:hypothetical protein
VLALDHVLPKLEQFKLDEARLNGTAVTRKLATNQLLVICVVHETDFFSGTLADRR